MARPLLTNNPYRNTSNTPKQRGRADEAIVKGLKWSGEKAKNNKILLGLCAVVALTVYNCVPWDKFSCESSSAPPSDESVEDAKNELVLNTFLKMDDDGEITVQVLDESGKSTDQRIIDGSGKPQKFSVEAYVTGPGVQPRKVIVSLRFGNDKAFHLEVPINVEGEAQNTLTDAVTLEELRAGKKLTRIASVNAN